MYFCEPYGICILAIILEFVTVALGVPILANANNTDLSSFHLKTRKAVIWAKTTVEFPGKSPVDEAIMQMGRVNVQTILHIIAQKIPGTPYLTVDNWKRYPQSSLTDKHVTFVAIVSELGEEYSGLYTGYYLYRPRSDKIREMAVSLSRTNPPEKKILHHEKIPQIIVEEGSKFSSGHGLGLGQGILDRA
ncbi:hypothetical protein J3R30DRAFT_3706311 [Lentinula aciculospora]|uniref:Uncharacterized protein n=1 Tax=Lentinula aciculospora TaxID=153920 RepID=A0A9W9A6Q2_9AGAR|nr:hypothetical protein J3R30DRAFT_3706311 [Lentinula aciculospora]